MISMTIVIMGLIIVLKDNHNPLKSYSDNNMLITMMIMFLVVTGIVEEKPDINNADVYAPNVNVSEQHVVQQSHERNEEEEDELPLLFIIICILMLLAILSVSNFIENYYLY